MQINVSQLLKASVGSVRNYEVNETINVAGSHILQGEVELMNTDQSILVKGTLSTSIEATCSRCLSLFNYPLTLKIEEGFFPATDVISGASLPLLEEPDSFTIDERFVLDLTEAVYQYMMMAIPMKPLCRQDCAGLRLHCGHNLNQGISDGRLLDIEPCLSQLHKVVPSK